MKRLLPILTLALLGAAVTASADNFYYDYYKDPGRSGVSNDYWFRDKGGGGPDGTEIYWNIYETQTDSFSYHDFSVARYSDWANLGNGNSSSAQYWENNLGKADIDNSNFYRIQVSGDNVDLYLTDFVDTALDEYNASALYNRITEYGYRALEQVKLDDGRTIYAAAGDTVVNTLSVADGTPYVKYANKTEFTELSTIDSVINQDNTIKRYQYYLGTFNDGDVIELYMKDSAEENPEGVYSYSGINEIDPATNAPVGPQGGFGDGGYGVGYTSIYDEELGENVLVAVPEVIEETDEMLNGYYYQDENLEDAGYNGFGEGDDAEAARAAAAAKSMPLSTLVPSSENGVYFGIIAKVDGVIYSPFTNHGGGNGTFGSPLPGGLPIALIAGLFGFGFCYVRRRKAIAD